MTPTTKTLLWLAFAWIATAAILTSAIRMFIDLHWYAGLVALAAAIIAAPPFRNRLQSRIKRGVPGLLLGIVSLGFFIYASSEAGADQERRALRATAAAEAAMKARVAKKLAESETEFNENKVQILSDVQTRFDDGDVEGAKSLLGRFHRVQDPDLVRLRRTVLGSSLRDELKQNLSEQRRAEVFTQLALLDPSDAEAAAMSAKLNERVNAKRIRESNLQAAAIRFKEQFSKWDGAHPAVERAIKSRMKNANSYEHVETRIGEISGENFTVITRYRGTNSFNAVITNTAIATVTPSGEVIWLDNQ